MSESHSLRDVIIEKAGDLFRAQGYMATSIKQIANAAGCTTAALYYHFEDGKRHILREVIRASAGSAQILRSLPEADTLEEFLMELAGVLARRLPEVGKRINWIMLEFGALPDDEKQVFQDLLLGIPGALRERIGAYVHDDATADRLTWLIFCSFFGYQQIFAQMEMGQRVDLSMQEYGRLLAHIVDRSM